LLLQAAFGDGLMRMRGEVRIGISGWTHAPWRGVFYPSGHPQGRELGYAAERFAAIEINGAFYAMQRPETYGHWRDATPDGFVFAVKGPRYITHLLRIKDVATPLANFFASGLLRLGPRLGPILWQFPARMKFDAERFDAFLMMLPHDTDSAIALARRHDHRVSGRAWLKCDVSKPIRHAVEIRHDTFRNPAFIDLLRRRQTALVCADALEWPRLMDVTSDFVYCRLHGSEELYASGYGDKALDGWAKRVDAWAKGGEPRDAERADGPAKPSPKGRDVFVFFDNDAKVRAPADAMALAKRLNAIPKWRGGS
jgi:uncharacterized protein YecE (DUF72 family)